MKFDICGIAQSILYPINIAEIGNRKVAFYAGYLDAINKLNL